MIWFTLDEDNFIDPAKPLNRICLLARKLHQAEVRIGQFTKVHMTFHLTRALEGGAIMTFPPVFRECLKNGAAKFGVHAHK